jgi:hypothetical protein
MDEHKSRQSPGMVDNQMGQSRNMFSLQEAEEVCKELCVFAIVRLIDFICFIFRSVNSYSSPSHSDI